MTFTPLKLNQDPFAFGNAMIEYRDGKPVGKVPLARPAYNPVLNNLMPSNGNGLVILELEDDA